MTSEESKEKEKTETFEDGNDNSNKIIADDGDKYYTENAEHHLDKKQGYWWYRRVQWQDK